MNILVMIATVSVMIVYLVGLFLQMQVCVFKCLFFSYSFGAGANETLIQVLQLITRFRRFYGWKTIIKCEVWKIQPSYSSRQVKKPRRDQIRAAHQKVIWVNEFSEKSLIVGILCASTNVIFPSFFSSDIVKRPYIRKIHQNTREIWH